MDAVELKESILARVAPEQREELKLRMEQPEVQGAFEKLEELSTSQEFVCSLMAAKNGDELLKIAGEFGLQMDKKSADTAFELMHAEDDAELTELDLDQVAGGFGLITYAAICAGAGVGVGIYLTVLYYKKRKYEKTCK